MELLAVIVILAVMISITALIIIGVINDAKKGALKNMAYGIIETGELEYAKDKLNDTEKEVIFMYQDGVETANVIDKKLDYKGAKPDAGTVIINVDGQIAIAIYDGDYCASKGYADSAVTLAQTSEDECQIPEIIPIVNADISGAKVPELANNMIPIKWDGIKWIKADSNNVFGKNQWYDYMQQRWANVALVSEATRTNYAAASAGITISEADVMAYLVWIPRYKYKLFNVNAISMDPQKIGVVFEDINQPKSSGITNGQYLTHPAFSFGGQELNGLWVGKFETTGNGTTPTIKPNVPALTNQITKDQFLTAKNFNNEATYGLISINDAHMIKNMEWGAITYLAESNYGKYGNPTYIEPEEDGYDYHTDDGPGLQTWPSVTGCAEIKEICGMKYQYQTGAGTRTSTTWNVYGVYDMAGGSFDRTMGAMHEASNMYVSVGESGFLSKDFETTDMSKYIDIYTYGTTSNDQLAYNRRQLGDATGEVRGWKYDSSRFISSTGGSWFSRGGRSSTLNTTGIFAFDSYNGSAHLFSSFRVVVVNYSDRRPRDPNPPQ